MVGSQCASEAANERTVATEVRERESFIELRSLRFAYDASRSSSRATTDVHADRGFHFACERLSIRRGETVAIVGPSGGGKTTLLSLIAGLLSPMSGEIRIGGERLDKLDDAGRRAFRIRQVGFIFQDFQLLDYLNVRENLSLPFRIHPAQRWSADAATEVQQVARRLGIEPFLDRRIQRLSQGERQRVAIGRALVTRPSLILGDEPTGNLDVATRDQVLELLFEQASQLVATLLIVTHDRELLDRFDRVVDIREFSTGLGLDSTEEHEGARR